MPEGDKVEITEISTRRYLNSSGSFIMVDVCNTCSAVVFDAIAHFKWHEAQARMTK